MSTLQRLYCGGVVAYCNGGVTDGTLPPSETTNSGGVSRGLVFLAKKETIITDLAVHNRHTEDCELMIAQTPGGVFYNAAVLSHIRRTPDTGTTIPKGISLDALVGRRYSLGSGEGLILMTNIAFLGLSALVVDVIGETN